MPKIIDINHLNQTLLKDSDCGCATFYDRNINLLDTSEHETIKDGRCLTLRHEIQHLQDDYYTRPKNSFDEWGDSIYWHYQKLKHGKQWNKEMEAAGMTSKHSRQYALSKPEELRSITAETKMEDLTEQYKSDMSKKFKMQPWIFNIKENKLVDGYTPQ